MTPDEAGQLLESQREHIERASAHIARRFSLTNDQSARLIASVYELLQADEYAALRRWKGLSSLTTYLTVVIAMVARELKARGPLTSSERVSAHLPVEDRPPGRRTRFLLDERVVSTADVRELRVVAADIVVGFAHFDALSGLAWTVLQPNDSYSFIAPAARAMGRRMLGTSYWSDAQSDFAASIAAEWPGAPLSLQTMRGEVVPAASVMVFDIVHPSGRDSARYVVVDFRSTATPIASLLPLVASPDAGTGSRPAA